VWSKLPFQSRKIDQKMRPWPGTDVMIFF
jgi:hypothetical protein